MMTPKEFAELKKVRVRVESQRAEINRLAAAINRLTAEKNELVTECHRLKEENAALKAEREWRVINSPEDAPPLTERRKMEDGDKVPEYWASEFVLIRTTSGVVDIASREEDVWFGRLKDYQNAEVKEWMPVPEWMKEKTDG